MSDVSIMQSALAATREYFREIFCSLERFLFKPADPAMLCLIRICAGSMLLYTHCVWAIDLLGFFGPHGRISPAFAQAFADPDHVGSSYAWSYLFNIQSPALLWSCHVLAIIVLAMLTVGLFSRVTSILALLITISYVHRAPGAQFGLDQINVMLAMYLAVGPCGAYYSVDRWLKKRRATSDSQLFAEAEPSTSANIAIRLIQLHLCVIYFFAGLSKLMGISWWEGTALWRSLATYEYQSINMLWLAGHPWLINLLTQVALVWEISYVFLIWSRSTRPIILALAVPVHLGIAMCMGMVTFGTVMLIANMAFISPLLVRRLLGPPVKAC